MKIINLSDKTFRRLTVIKRNGNKGREPAWLCRCSCGNKVIVAGNNLRSGNTESCGCLTDENRRKLKHDLTGRRYGFLNVINRAPNKGRRVAWLCMCDCGNETTVSTEGMIRGYTKSCGCKVAELVSEARKKPNRRGKEYRTWINIKSRCRNPNVKAFPDYGGRGIDICDEWADDFDLFFADVGFCPDPTYEIDRIDNEQGYKPGNVRWTTRLVNARNKRNTKR